MSDESTWSGPLPLFTSRAAEDYDPALTCEQRSDPDSNHARGAISTCPWCGYDPLFRSARPWFEPTSDDEPLSVTTSTGEHRFSIQAIDDAVVEFARANSARIEWSPRDRNRNSVLIAFRREGDPVYKRDAARLWLHWASNGDFDNKATAAEVEHARRVFARLAA